MSNNDIPPERDLRKMEWLYHVDLSIDAHKNGDEIAKTAKLVYENMLKKRYPERGLTLVMAVVKTPEA